MSFIDVFKTQIQHLQVKNQKNEGAMMRGLHLHLNQEQIERFNHLTVSPNDEQIEGKWGDIPQTIEHSIKHSIKPMNK